jgi:hypothetical protein
LNAKDINKKRWHMQEFIKKSDKNQTPEGKQNQADINQNTDIRKQAADFTDHRQITIEHREIQKKTNASKSNKTGLPNHLKSGIENLSGYSMDDVKVHYNSDKPAQLQAHAYAQGTDIHLGSGQEKHLPHEAWHVVQQKQGRVKPTVQLKGKININDNAGLEKEADVMGKKTIQSSGNEPGFSPKKISKSVPEDLLQRVVKVGETVFTPEMVYRYLTAHITNLKNYIDKKDLKLAIEKKCEAKDGRNAYTVDKISAWDLLNELVQISGKAPLKEMKFEEQGLEKPNAPKKTDIASLMEHLKDHQDPVMAFRQYMFDPAVFYVKTGVKDEFERLLDATRRKVETLIAGELLQNATTIINKEVMGLIAAVPKMEAQLLETQPGLLTGFDSGDDFTELIDIILGRKPIAADKIAVILKDCDTSDQVSQFLSAFEIFSRDRANKMYPESSEIVENILKNLALIQIVNWVAKDYKIDADGTFEAVSQVYNGSNPSYGSGRGREDAPIDSGTKKKTTIERGITFDSHLKGGPTKKIQDQVLKHPAFSAAGNSIPGELVRKEDAQGLKKRFENPGWLERARKHNQPFVNSISGICLMFRNIQEMYKKSIGTGIKPPDKKDWHKMEALLSASIVYFPGGHTFHECIKGFKAGGQIKVDAKQITAEEHLKWKEFCYSQDFIPDAIIISCLQKLELALKTPINDK